MKTENLDTALNDKYSFLSNYHGDIILSTRLSTMSLL